MNREKSDIVIAGAGVIGLAIAAELANNNRVGSIILLEKEEHFGRGISCRNSEVIHAGIYYPTGSLKARFSLEGNALLKNFCEKWAIKHRYCGKLIVANSDEEARSLERLGMQAVANGVKGIKVLDHTDILQLEPHVRAQRALFSATTGIIDSHGLMARLEKIALNKGVLIAYRHEILALEQLSDGCRVHFQNPDGSSDYIDTLTVINCCGLQADSFAAMCGIDIEAAGYRQYYCKGEYFSTPSQYASLVQHLIYPPPLYELTGLGIHATKTLDGRMLLGPNASYIEDENYLVDPDRAAEFYEAVKPFLPFLEKKEILPEMAGIRPKLSGPGEPFRDFIIAREDISENFNLINLLGIESPGLTSCLSIARHVDMIVKDVSC